MRLELFVTSCALRSVGSSRNYCICSCEARKSISSDFGHVPRKIHVPRRTINVQL
jgi:hypothetical protein